MSESNGNGLNKEDDRVRYARACHAMQSGVAAEMGYLPNPTTPKHLRVGVNSSMCEHAALVRLLIAKGLFTEDEYFKELADEMEREVATYERRLSEHLGRDIKLS